MRVPKRGEIWLADLGLAAKVRPVLVLSAPYADSDYALMGVVPHTTTRRGAQFEVELRLPFLEQGVFNVQGMLAVPAATFMRPVASLRPQQLFVIEAMVKRWLGLEA
jgi:mRNA interferase MazF